MSRARIEVAAVLVVGLVSVAVGAPVPEVRKAAPSTARKDLFGDPLPPGAVVRLGTQRYRHPGGFIVGLGVTPDGGTIVTADRHGSVFVWEAASGRAVRSWNHMYHFADFALSRDGKRFAVTGPRFLRPGEGEIVIRIEEVATGKEVRTWQRQVEYAGKTQIAFTPDGRKLASINSDGIVRLQDIDTGAEVVRLTLARGDPSALAVSADGTTVAVSLGPTVSLWRWQAEGKPVEINTTRGLMTLAFSPDGKFLAGGDDTDGGVRIWDASTGKKVRTLKPGSLMRWVRYSPDGKYLVGASHTESTLFVWDAKSGKEIHRFAGQARPPDHAVFTADSRRLVAEIEGTLRIWDVESGQETIPFADSHVKTPRFVQLVGNVAVTSGDSTVRFWDAATGKQTRRLEVSDGWLRGTAVSPNRRWLATSEVGRKHAVCLWEARTGKLVYRLAGHGASGGKRDLLFTPDNKRLVSWGEDQYLRVWDVKTGKATEEHTIRPDGQGGPVGNDPIAQREMVTRFAFGRMSDDGQLFSLPRSGWLYLFEVSSGKQQAKLKDEAGFGRVAFSPDKKKLVSANWGMDKRVMVEGKQQVVREDPTIRIFDVPSGVPLASVSLPHGVIVDALAFHPEGKRFAATVIGETASIRTFDVAGNDRGKFELPARAWSLAYSADGKRLIAGLEDATALIFEAPTR